MELLKKYQRSVNLLKIEITESAYAEDDERIRQSAKRLQDAGFFVMMDDFGSGNSSLNMLKSVAVDVLKLDMCFLDMTEQTVRDGFFKKICFCFLDYYPCNFQPGLYYYGKSVFERARWYHVDKSVSETVQMCFRRKGKGGIL